MSALGRLAALAMPALAAGALLALVAGGPGGELASGAALAQPTAAIDLGSDEQRAAGAVLYAKYCAQCHGDDGAGKGVAAPFLKPAPRDFTSAKYKVRSTPTGGLPTDEDMARVIREGLPYTAMPGFNRLTEPEIQNLVYHLKTYSEDFADPDAYIEPIDIPSPPPMSEESISAGRELYEQTGCARCHGDLGRGDGMSAPTLVDDWGQHIRAADLSMPWTFRGGAEREDIFRTMSTGFTGTPMPGFHGALPVEDIWKMTDYILSLSDGAGENGTEAPYKTLVTAVGYDGELDLELGRELFAEAPEAMFPIVGQIVQPGRDFYPSAVAVRVAAVYNHDEIAFLVSWHDMAAETSGANGPDLEVPLFLDDNPELALGAGDEAASESEDEGGFWGDEAVDESDGAEPAGDDGMGFWGDDAADEPAVAADGGDEGDFWGDAAADSGDDAGAGDAGGFWGDDDDGEAAGTGPQSEFSDAVALQFPRSMPEGIRRPYFLFGDLENPVELWYADLAADRGKLYEARGSGSITEAETGVPEVLTEYADGRWTVIFKRDRAGRSGISFEEGRFIPVAATVWDGFNRERGNKRGLTQWYDVYLEPLEKPSPVGPMLKAALAVLALELLIIGLVRRSHRRRSMERVEQPA